MASQFAALSHGGAKKFRMLASKYDSDGECIPHIFNLLIDTDKGRIIDGFLG